MSDEHAITPQDDALNRCREILGEHFTAFVVVGLTQEDDGTDGVDYIANSNTMALGLLARAHHEMLHDYTGEDEP